MNRAPTFRRGVWSGLLGVLCLLLAACSGAATVPPTTTSSPAAVTATDAASTQTAARPPAPPVPRAVCAELRDALVRQLSLDVRLREVSVRTSATGDARPGCQLSASGSAAELGAFPDVAARLRALLTAAGWSEDPRELADGPTGTASSYRKNNVLTRALVEWQPAPDASCPADQPISACQLAPEQQLLTITLELTQQ